MSIMTKDTHIPQKISVFGVTGIAPTLLVRDLMF
jgi:hypothetical protein